MRRFLIPVCALVMFWACSNDSDDKKNNPLSDYYGIPNNISKYTINNDLGAYVGIGGMVDNYIWLSLHNADKSKVWSFHGSDNIEQLTFISNGELSSFKPEKIYLNTELCIDNSNKRVVLSTVDAPMGPFPKQYNTIAVFDDGAKQTSHIYNHIETMPSDIKIWNDNTVMLRSNSGHMYYCYGFDGVEKYKPTNTITSNQSTLVVDLWKAIPITDTDCFYKSINNYRIDLSKGVIIWKTDWLYFDKKLREKLNISSFSTYAYEVLQDNGKDLKCLVTIKTQDGDHYQDYVYIDINTGELI